MCIIIKKDNITVSDANTKISQQEKQKILSTLSLNRASVYEDMKIGDSVGFSYMHKKIKISGKGIIIRIINRDIKSIQILCKKDNLVIKLMLHDATLSINKVSSYSKRTRKSQLNHLVKKHMLSN